MRDGIHLQATLYLPDSQQQPAPTVITLTPYIAQTYHEQGLYFAAHGHPFLAVDVRGRGNSDGAFRPFVNEAKDGFDVVEWVSRQPYCDGKVVMWGGSYAGYNQWMTAKERPPHLATIVPAAAPYVGADFWMRNNIPFPYLMRWLTLVSGRTSQDKMFWNNEDFWHSGFRTWFESGRPFRELDTLLGNPSPVFQQWLEHPTLDVYSDAQNPSAEEYSRLSIPILTLTGIYDSDQPGALSHYRELMRNASAGMRAKHYLVIGPWHHAGTRQPQKQFAGVTFGDASLIDLGELHLQWYAWTAGSGPKPPFLQKNVAYYVTGAEHWRYADTLESITAEHRPLYLSSSGSASRIFASGLLQAEAHNSAADEYVYDPRDTSIARLEAAATDPVCLRPTFPTESLNDQTLLFAMEGKQLFYHSEPFSRHTEISGFFRLQVWLSIDQPDTDFSVRIYEIDDTGASLLLTTDTLRARYRESLRQEKLIQTPEPLRYDFERFTFVSRLVRTGSRLRLIIGPLHSIHFQKNYNSGGVVSDESIADARPVTVRLFHDQARPSALYLPLGRCQDECG